jgi:hypothetical protein
VVIVAIEGVVFTAIFPSARKSSIKAILLYLHRYQFPPNNKTSTPYIAFFIDKVAENRFRPHILLFVVQNERYFNKKALFQVQFKRQA